MVRREKLIAQYLPIELVNNAESITPSIQVAQDHGELFEVRQLRWILWIQKILLA